ncbi:hypothetical protein GOV11_00835 [Candidatus Woesearchaeota archaeon]|nr:hypothetical protein [Candidatus Woesearchaeota archaeon]
MMATIEIDQDEVDKILQLCTDRKNEVMRKFSRSWAVEYFDELVSTVLKQMDLPEEIDIWRDDRQNAWGLHRGRFWQRYYQGKNRSQMSAHTMVGYLNGDSNEQLERYLLAIEQYAYKFGKLEQMKKLTASLKEYAEMDTKGDFDGSDFEWKKKVSIPVISCDADWQGVNVESRTLDLAAVNDGSCSFSDVGDDHSVDLDDTSDIETVIVLLQIGEQKIASMLNEAEQFAVEKLKPLHDWKDQLRKVFSKEILQERIMNGVKNGER